MKKTKIIIFLLAMGVALFSSVFAYAQMPTSASNMSGPAKLSPEELEKIKETAKNTIMLADVIVYNAKIDSTNGNKYKISFDILNQKETQTGIKYYIQLLKKDNDTSRLYHQKAYDEVLTLGKGEKQHRTIEYEAPYFASGDFELWVVSDQINGLPLGQAKVAGVNLKGSSGYIQVNGCYLKIDGEKSNTKYKLYQGVDLSKDENMSLVCQIKNNFKKQQSVTPVFNTFYRNVTGKLISKRSGSSFTIASGQEKEMAWPVPKENTPQAYDFVFTLDDSNDKTVSDYVYAHYVTQGLSGTIQNLLLDKDSYAAGETAKVSFFWSNSADNFINSRGAGTRYDKAYLELMINDASGKACADPFRKELSSGPLGQEKEEIPIKVDCSNNPKVSAVLKDDNGNTLDSLSAIIGKPGNVQPIEQKNKKVIYMILALAVSIILALIAFLTYWKKKGNGTANIILFFVLLSAGILYGKNSQAATFYSLSYYYGFYYSTVFEANLDRGPDPTYGVPTYSANENMGVYGRARTLGCNNAHTMMIAADINSQSKYVVPPTWTSDTGYRFQSFTANSSAGRYPAVFRALDQGLVDYVFTARCNSTPYTTPPWCELSWADAYKYASGSAAIDYQVIPLSCAPDSSCLSHTVTWGACSATACGTAGTISGTCDDGCGGIGYSTPLTCSAPACCVSTCTPSTWSTCLGSCGGNPGIQTGQCVDGCGITQTISQNCTTEACCSSEYSCIISGECKKENCGGSITRGAICRESCGGETVSQSKCGSSCKNETVNCPTCDDPAWKEVAP